MEQKRKIVIPLGEGSRSEAGAGKDFDGAATVRAPLFDEEATMGARPVVPIAAVYPQPSTRFPLLAIVVILAVSAGVAGGFFIGLYKSGQNREGAPAAATTTVSAEQASQAPAQEQLPATIASEKSPVTEPPPAVTAAENAKTERAVREEKPKRDDVKVSAPVEVREPEREQREERTLARQEEREMRRQQRQERRRRAREREEAESADINQQIERGTRELNRIREIFEGQHP